jgi:[acyl-carrier-protein] S-malonyltransferase
MQNAVPLGEGSMSALLGITEKIALDHLKSLCDELSRNKKFLVQPANYNCPGQLVIAGTVLGIAQLQEKMKTDPLLQKTKCIPLPVSAPFHCPLMEPAQEFMKPLLTNTPFKAPQTPLIANFSANIVNKSEVIAEALRTQITAPVLWQQSMELLKTLAPNSALIEIGPGKTLTGLMKRIDKTYPSFNISTLQDMTEVLK